MHTEYQSRKLIDSLYAHGFCCSYDEVQQFERSACLVETGDIVIDTNEKTCVQFAADNVDHNIVTLDGKGTFHGMGIMAMMSPATPVKYVVPRRNVTPSEILKAAHIEIKNFFPECNIHEGLVFNQIVDPNIPEPYQNVDILWKSSVLFCPSRPQWNGFMQMVHNNKAHPGKSSFIYLPMIDMDPNNLTCIYSTLNYVADQAATYDVSPVITFDQPLWWKAFGLVQSSPHLRPIVLRLGGLHTEMSFVGSVGHLMGGSEIENVLEVVYAENSVPHMLSGKAISRAVRGHWLTLH